jgi:hypothetical protein
MGFNYIGSTFRASIKSRNGGVEQRVALYWTQFGAVNGVRESMQGTTSE